MGLTNREKASLNSETCSSVRESAYGDDRVSGGFETRHHQHQPAARPSQPPGGVDNGRQQRRIRGKRKPETGDENATQSKGLGTHHVGQRR